MKIEELVESLKPKPDALKAPLQIPITEPARLIGPIQTSTRSQTICLPFTPHALRQSLSADLVAGIERRHQAVERSLAGRNTVLMFDPFSGTMQRRVIRPDGHLGGVEP